MPTPVRRGGHEVDGRLHAHVGRPPSAWHQRSLIISALCIAPPRSWQFHAANVAELARVQEVGDAVGTSPEFLRIQLQTPAPKLGFLRHHHSHLRTAATPAFQSEPPVEWPKMIVAPPLHNREKYPCTLLREFFGNRTFHTNCTRCSVVPRSSRAESSTHPLLSQAIRKTAFTTRPNRKHCGTKQVGFVPKVGTPAIRPKPQ